MEHELTIQMLKKDAENWHCVNDNVMGGQSKSECRILENGGLDWNGSVSLKNSGGFASVRYLLEPALDLHNYRGIGLYVIGDSKTYKLNLANHNTSKSPRFQTRFPTDTTKQCIHIPFTSLQASVRGKSVIENFNLSQLSMLGFLIADQQEGIFHLTVNRITAYV